MTLFCYYLQREFIYIIFFYSIVFISPAFCQTNESFGYLKINSDSSGIEIRLNDQPLGCTPLPIIPLPPGNYQVSALHPDPYLWGNLDWQDSIKIVSHDTLLIQPQFKTIFSIRTNPFGAEVFLNSEFQGESPLSVSLNSHKSYQLLLKKDGFRDYFIDLNQVKNNFLNVNLVKNQNLLSINDFEKQKQKKSRNRYRTLTYSLWGLSILTGLSTVYLKDQADDKYKQYLVAGSLSEMNKYYNDAKRYDRYTYVSLGVLQGCFVLSFYFLMKSLN